MTDLTLYRVADAHCPYFGQFSHWTPSRNFAGEFLQWLNSDPTHRQADGYGRRVDEPALYRTVVPSDLVDDWRPPGHVLVLPDDFLWRLALSTVGGPAPWLRYWRGGALTPDPIDEVLFLGDRVADVDRVPR